MSLAIVPDGLIEGKMCFQIFQRFCLVTISLLITWLTLEFLISPFVVKYTPLNVAPFIYNPYRFLSQSSKSSAVPKDYIVLLGDSNAQGEGDWLHEISLHRSEPFHSAHIINELTNIDVITLGQSGSGSLGGFIARPFSTFHFLTKSWRYVLPKPKVILAYFYEGNDLNDNFRDFTNNRRLFKKNIKRGNYFQRFINMRIIRNWNAKYIYHWYDDFVFTRFVVNLLTRSDESRPPRNKKKRQYSQQPSIANVGHNLVTIPGNLQYPGQGLSHAELSLAIYIFRQSIKRLKQEFPQSRIVVVYIPAPLSCYDIKSDYVSAQIYRGDTEFYPTPQIQRRSNLIIDKIKAVSLSENVEFFNSKPALVSAAKTETIHGPNDWNHLNRHGYTVFGKAISDYLVHQ